MLIPKCGTPSGGVRTVTCPRGCRGGCGTVIDYTVLGSTRTPLYCPNCKRYLMDVTGTPTIVRWQTPDGIIWNGQPDTCRKCNTQVWVRFVPGYPRQTYEVRCPLCGELINRYDPNPYVPGGYKPEIYRQNLGKLPATCPQPAPGWSMMETTCGRCRSVLCVEYRNAWGLANFPCPRCGNRITLVGKAVRSVRLKQ